MQALNMIFYTGIVLGVLVFIHELGHFLAAKFCGMRVDRFSIGFPPRAFGKKIGDTDYCVSWIPLGGYVKIAGMVDESFDTEFMNREPQPWEFRAKPMWARMFVICAGVIMNILLAIVIFWGIHYSKGRDTVETTEIGYVAEQSAAKKAGLLAGDKILSVNGTPTTHWEELQNVLYIDNMGDDLTININRNGKEQSVFIPHSYMPTLSEEASIGISIAHTVSIINSVELGMPAEKLGLLPADTLLTFNSKPVTSRQEIITYIKSHADSNIALEWKRGSEIMKGTTRVSKEGRIGISIGVAYTGPIKHIQFTVWEAFSEGINEVGRSVRLFYLTISKIFVGKAKVKDSFGGPLTIAKFASQSAELGMVTFLIFMAQLSMTLAIMNILPIPALDGGHLVMLIYEKVSRREIPNKIKLGIQQAGFILLLAFMAFVIYNDFTRF
jgi:regulator of sigma E protease